MSINVVKIVGNAERLLTDVIHGNKSQYIPEEMIEFGRITEGEILFENFCFEEPINLRIGANSKIYFKNCEFSKSVDFSGNGTEFEFSDCTFEESFFFKVSATQFSFNGFNAVSKMIQVTGQIGKIYFNSFSLDKLVVEVYSGVTNEIKVSDGSIADKFEITGNLTSKIVFYNTSIGNLCFKKFTSNNTSTIEIKEKSDVGVIESDFKGKMTFIDISEMSKIGKIDFLRQEMYGLSINSGSKITECLLNVSKIEKYFSFDGQSTKIGSLNITGRQETSVKGIINGCQIEKLNMFDYINDGVLEISDIQFNSDAFICIHNSSNLGKARIINVDFSKAKMVFENSIISDAIIVSSDFPLAVHNKTIQVDFKQSKFLFGQLHTVFQKLGDSVRAYEYQAREVSSYFSSLSIISKDWDKVVTLFLNRISNDFGRKWGMGVLFSIAVGLLFFSLLVPSTQQYNIGFSGEETIRLIPPFLKFMNPLRHFETMELFKNIEGGNAIVLSNWSYLWDFLGRIFVAYGYYQTIQAFRKYGRK